MYTYEELKGFVDHCRRCPLSGTRNKAVMGQGNLLSGILFIAEAPGAHEDRDGIPFTGPSGRVFDELLEEIGLVRQDIYLTNIVKCPSEGQQRSQTGGAGGVYRLSKVRNLFDKSKDYCLPWKDCGSENY